MANFSFFAVTGSQTMPPRRPHQPQDVPNPRRLLRVVLARFVSLKLGRVCKVLPTTKMVLCRHLRNLEKINTIQAEASIFRVCVHALVN